MRRDRRLLHTHGNAIRRRAAIRGETPVRLDRAGVVERTAEVALRCERGGVLAARCRGARQFTWPGAAARVRAAAGAARLLDQSAALQSGRRVLIWRRSDVASGSGLHGIGDGTHRCRRLAAERRSATRAQQRAHHIAGGGVSTSCVHQRFRRSAFRWRLARHVALRTR